MKNLKKNHTCTMRSDAGKSVSQAIYGKMLLAFHLRRTQFYNECIVRSVMAFLHSTASEIITRCLSFDIKKKLFRLSTRSWMYVCEWVSLCAFQFISKRICLDETFHIVAFYTDFLEIFKNWTDKQTQHISQ